MRPADWESWLRKWLGRNPLKSPPAHLLERFTDEVMARIRPQASPSQVLRPRWTLQPRWGLAWSGALVAAVLLLAVSLRPSGGPLGLWDLDTELLREDSFLEEMAAISLEEDLAEADRIVLADAVGPQEESRILELWEELEQGGEAPAPEELGTEEEILEELRWWDDDELALS